MLRSDFAIIRSNWGVWEDSVFKRDWPRIKAAGIVRGAYLFLRFPHPKYKMKAPDPVAQARALVNTVGSLDESDFPPTIDVEFPDARRVTGMTARQCLDGVRAAWKVLKDYYRVAPIIYTSARVWHEDLDDLAAPDLVESPLWLARYPFKKGPAVRDARVSRLNPPPVPPSWGDATNWWIHQYQGDAIRLPGFPTGNVDMNRFNTMQDGCDRRSCEVGPAPARCCAERPVRRGHGQGFARLPEQEGPRLEWRRRPAHVCLPLLVESIAQVSR